MLIVYHHIVYPIILRFYKNNQEDTTTSSYQRHYTNSLMDNSLPSITIVIPAYNEEQWVAEKIRNLASLDYPNEQLSIVIACDGCNDNTAAIANITRKELECQHLNINVVNFKANRGKVAVLNDVIPTISTDLIALSDVSALISIDALLIAAERFKDPNVGVLNGHYRLLTPGSIGEQAYWEYQSQIKRSEAKLGGTLGSHGAFYLFRTQLFEKLPVDTINDDFILPMKIVAAGYRSDYDNGINALELENASTTQDHLRRRRIAAGNFQQLFRLKALLLPRYGLTAFTFISGKGLRVLMPFLMIIALLGCAALAFNSLLFATLLGLQVIAYGLAIYEIIFKPHVSHKICKLLAYAVGGHTAGFIGAMRYILRLDKGRWFKLNP
jgi:cellulose synthase/poly-beta-1,6-N-acetylglucosamine synthase-like glycosyltransferase